MEIFILPSGCGNADVLKLKSSTESFARRYRLVKSLADISTATVQRDRYMIMYDNEFVDSKLANAIPVYMSSDFDVCGCFKRTQFGTEDEKMCVSPRIFKKHVRPAINSLTPLDIHKLSFTRILDGWIEENVQPVD